MRPLVVTSGAVRAVLTAAALLLAIVAVSPAQGQHLRPQPSYCPPPPCPAPAAEVPPTAVPTEPTPPVAEAPALTPERAGALAGETVALATPNMIGQFIGFPVNTVIRLPSGATTTARIPLLNRGAFDIAENESPRPTDRVFVTYNFYHGVFESGGAPNFDAHFEMIGFEKTFLNGNASIGMRLPFFQTAGDRSVSQSDIGDLSVILKYAFINDRDTGNVLSTGLVVTAPTGSSGFTAIDGTHIHDTLLQPWLGFIWNRDSLYLHGFSSIVVPTESRDVTLLFNDIGVGYWLYRNPDGLVSGIAPTLEAHVTTPLTHRESSTNVVVVPEWVVLTGGFNFALGRRSTLVVGAATPVTGPQPFDFEALVQLNLRF